MDVSKANDDESTGGPWQSTDSCDGPGLGDLAQPSGPQTELHETPRSESGPELGDLVDQDAAVQEQVVSDGPSPLAQLATHEVHGQQEPKPQPETKSETSRGDESFGEKRSCEILGLSESKNPVLLAPTEEALKDAPESKDSGG